ncbi:MAG: hypothetical protein U1G07_04830 [Verrucomicrobiota bacterium]
MNPREKRLVLAVGGILGVILLGLGLRTFFLKPLRDIDKKTGVLRDRLAKVKKERLAYFAAEDLVKGFTQRTFADQIDQASAKSGEVLTRQILDSGLREADFSRLPVGPRKLRGASEIGWSVQGQGKLPEVVNLLFLLQRSPYLHRIENLTMSGGEAAGEVRVGFRFLTLVLQPAPDVALTPLAAKFTIESPERRTYDGIAARDLLRPYIKRAVDATPPTPSPTSKRPVGPAALRVVSLSEWMGQPEVHVRDLSNQQTARYRVGDALADGTIAMVDYRPLPMPGNEALQSFSRVILKIGDEFWAVEKGQTLADKRRLTPDQLPSALAKFQVQ